MASLQLNFSDVYNRVSSFLGWGSSPSGTNLTNAKNIVYRGYINFLNPVIELAGKRKKYLWSFLIKYGELVTKDDQWVYELPSDYENVDIWFEHDEDSGYPRIKKIDPQMLLRKRSNCSSSSYPTFCAIRAGRYDKSAGQIYEVMFFETPNQAYNIPYYYVISPPKPEDSTDVFIGGVFASEVIMECALALAEQEYDDIIGHHTALVKEKIANLIEMDRGHIPETVGKITDGNIRVISFARPLNTISEDTIYT